MKPINYGDLDEAEKAAWEMGFLGLKGEDAVMALRGVAKDASIEE